MELYVTLVLIYDFSVWKRALEFDWGHNKLAIVEEEKDNEYIVFQYWIDDDAKFQLCKNTSGDPQAAKWILKRLDSGKVLIGKKRSYLESNELTQKSID